MDPDPTKRVEVVRKKFSEVSTSDDFLILRLKGYQKFLVFRKIDGKAVCVGYKRDKINFREFQSQQGITFEAGMEEEVEIS